MEWYTYAENDVPKQSIGQRIRELRKARGYTQGQLAEILGWGDRGQVRVSHYEISRRKPGIAQLSQLADALGVKINDICDEADLPKSAGSEPADIDERRRLVRLYNQLGEGRRESALAYMESLLMGESEDRAKMVGELRHIAKLSTPRTQEMIEAIAKVVSEGALSDTDAGTVKALVTSLGRK